jgi:hypothetical protein
LVELIVGGTGVLDESGHRIGGRSVPLKRVARSTINLLRAVYLDHSIHSVARGDYLFFSQAERRLASLLRTSAERFIVAHELGHVIVRWSRQPLDSLRFYQGMAKSLPDDFYGLQAIRRATVEQEWAEELTADNLGARLCIEYHTNSAEQWAALLGVDLFLQMQRLFELYHLHIDGRSPDTGNHPPMSLRAASLDKNVELSSPPAELMRIRAGYLRSAERMFDRAIKPTFLDRLAWW